MSPVPAMPTTSVANINGAMIVLMRFRNSVDNDRTNASSVGRLDSKYVVIGRRSIQLTDQPPDKDAEHKADDYLPGQRDLC